MTGDNRALEGWKILVVEDEPFIAYDIMDGLEGAGGLAVGPAGTVTAALQLISSTNVDAAVLDVNLHDGDVVPVVEKLTARGIPFIIHTGAGLTAELRDGFPSLEVYHKPTSPERLAAAIALLLNS